MPAPTTRDSQVYFSLVSGLKLEENDLPDQLLAVCDPEDGFFRTGLLGVISGSFNNFFSFSNLCARRS